MVALAVCIVDRVIHPLSVLLSMMLLPVRKCCIKLYRCRCYICMRKNHLSRNCRVSSNCRVCQGRHHMSIYPSPNTDQVFSRSQGSIGSTTAKSPSPQGSVPTSTLYVGSQTPVLLQTAKVQLINPASTTSLVVARAIMDSGSQRTYMYVTSRIRSRLKPTYDQERVATDQNLRSY